MRLAGKRCLIVGGTSGIGQAAARQFLAEGAHVVAVGLPDTHTDLGGAHIIHADATCSSEVEAFFTDALSFLKGLDVLYHVAGGSGRRFGDGSLHECSDDGWRETLNLNLTSAFLTNRAAIRHFLAERQRGVILNTASVLATAPSPQHFDTVAYTAAKGGVIALSRQAAAKYAPNGIRINVLAPGLIDTPMASRAIGDPSIQAFLAAKQPLAGGPGIPEDLADAAVFLCSDAARLITGAVLCVDGGWCVS